MSKARNVPLIVVLAVALCGGPLLAAAIVSGGAGAATFARGWPALGVSLLVGATALAITGAWRRRAHTVAASGAPEAVLREPTR